MHVVECGLCGQALGYSPARAPGDYARCYCFLCASSIAQFGAALGTFAGGRIEQVYKATEGNARRHSEAMAFAGLINKLKETYGYTPETFLDNFVSAMVNSKNTGEKND